ncbi:HNH endonuclease signature motif containing protein [Vibrio sp. M260121]|uniref:HNH endonuclease signature motif containing protein n=1 Tax=Vibrio sp. M260121 TaxID=3020897 RepID=UPI002F3F174F
MDGDDIEKKRIATSSGGGYTSLVEKEVRPKTQTLGESLKQLAERQRLARKEELTYSKEDEARWAANRERVIGRLEKIEVPSFDLDETLANPELDAVNSVKLDPASMLADDIEALAKEGKEFINKPTLAGAASMAVIAIPGKFLDDAGGRLVKEAFERNPFKEINGRKIINSDLAGKAVKAEGGEVFFDFDGFPDFTPYAEKIVRVDGLTGNRAKDEKLAMQVLGLNGYNKKDMVWHHHQDAKSMMLVPKNVHSVGKGGVSHTGGSAIIKHNKSNPENILNYMSPPEKK